MPLYYLDAGAKVNGIGSSVEATGAPDLSIGYACTVGGLASAQAYIFKARSSSGFANLEYGFYLDPNSSTMASSDEYLAGIVETSSTDLVRVSISYITGTGYRVKVWAGKDDGSGIESAAYAITDARHSVKVIVTRASSSSAADGVVRLYVDAVLQEKVERVDNYDLFPLVDQVDCGLCSGVDATIAGTIYVDSVEIVGDVTIPAEGGPPEVVIVPALGVEYKIVIYDADGVKKAEVTDFQALVVARRVNEAGMIRFTLAGDHAAVGVLEDKSLVEAWRRNLQMGIGWTRELTALYRYQRRSYVDQSLFEAMCPGALSKLGWRSVLWYSGTSNRSKFVGVKAETVMKTLVDYNAGANATTGNGRLRTGAITGLSVQTDGARGATIDYHCAWDNLLDALRGVARIGAGDFDLVRTATGDNTFEFRWYTGQLGTDRHALVTFALGYGNMANPVYEYDRMEERTVAVVAGQGEAGGRATTIVEGPDYAAGNDIETFVDARDVDTADGRTSRGNRALDEKRARPAFSFGVLQTPGCYYGLHYFLGDLCTARYDTLEETVKVMGVTMTVDREKGEQIEVETEIV